MLDNKSVQVPGVNSVQWSPKAHIISYWVPEKDHVPARVGLMTIPDKQEIRERHMYRVSDVQMEWQAKGDYLAVRFECFKSKKTKTTKVEIFRMRGKGIPIEDYELKDSVHDFAWEPNGDRFSLVHGNENKPNVSFFQLAKRKL